MKKFIRQKLHEHLGSGINEGVSTDTLSLAKPIELSDDEKNKIKNLLLPINFSRAIPKKNATRA